jgi:hypothetical protein
MSLKRRFERGLRNAADGGPLLHQGGGRQSSARIRGHDQGVAQAGHVEKFQPGARVGSRPNAAAAEVAGGKLTDNAVIRLRTLRSQPPQGRSDRRRGIRPAAQSARGSQAYPRRRSAGSRPARIILASSQLERRDDRRHQHRRHCRRFHFLMSPLTNFVPHGSVACDPFRTLRPATFSVQPSRTGYLGDLVGNASAY